MVTFTPNYSYVPTPQRTTITGTRRRLGQKQLGIVRKLQQIKSSSTPSSTARLLAAVTTIDKDRGDKLGTRGTSTIYGVSNNRNNNENDDDDSDLPTIEELIFTTLREQGGAVGDRAWGENGPEMEAAAKESSGSIEYMRLAQSDNSGRSLDNPILLLEGDDSSASETEADKSIRAKSTESNAGFLDSPEIVVDKITPAYPNPDGWYDIDDFPETTSPLRLAEQGASASDFMHSYASSRLSSEPLHDSISIDGSRYARSRATTFSSSPPPHKYRASLENQVVIPEMASKTSQPVNRRQSLPNRISSLEPSQDDVENDNYNDEELSNTDSGDDIEESRPMKRKRQSSFGDGVTRKKFKHCLRQRSSGSKPYQQQGIGGNTQSTLVKSTLDSLSKDPASGDDGWTDESTAELEKEVELALSKQGNLSSISALSSQGSPLVEARDVIQSPGLQHGTTQSLEGGEDEVVSEGSWVAMQQQEELVVQKLGQLAVDRQDLVEVVDADNRDIICDKWPAKQRLAPITTITLPNRLSRSLPSLPTTNSNIENPSILSTRKVVHRESLVIDKTHFRTRSGRTSVRPVAFWKHEGVMYSDIVVKDRRGNYNLRCITGTIRVKGD